eukprot:scaffold5497_cov135-Cylindrotheca_fusiformis.AAC.5
MGIPAIGNGTINQSGGMVGGLGGLYVFALLVEVAHVSCDRLGEVAGDIGDVEAGPGGEVALADGLQQGRLGRAEEASV